MIIYVFGNEDHSQDSLGITVSQKLTKDFPEIDFHVLPPNSDIPINQEKTVNIIDAADGISEVTLITEKNLNKIVISPRSTLHDYDLSFQLKYLIKIGRLKNFNIVGLPLLGKVDYDLIHSIFKKLVAQDMQGS